MRKLYSVLIFSFCLLVLVGCSDKKSSEYRASLKNVADEITANASEVEVILDKYSTVWSYSIKNRSPVGIDSMAQAVNLDRSMIEKYFEINPANNVSNDFSSNIHSLLAYYEGEGKISSIKEASESIKNKIIELNNPPTEYEKAYNEVLDMYSLSEEYTEMALNPTGTMQTFNENKNRLSGEIIGKHKRIEVVMPKEK